MFLTGSEIQKNVSKGSISITPFNLKNMNPHSYNLTIADEIITYKEEVLDPKKVNQTEFTKIPKTGIILKPGELYLARTVERVNTNKFASVFDGRSSIGRLGIFTHVTAGYIDVGFSGFITLEIVVAKPVIIYPFMQVGQISFIELKGDISLYKSSKYQNNNGIQASMMFKEFS